MKNYEKLLNKLNKALPKFPDGRIDYHNSKDSAVINIFVFYNKKLLLLKRSTRVGNYRGRWNVVAGYLDELKPLEEKALEELKEETGISEDQINKITPLPCFKIDDKEIDKIFHCFPVLVELKNKPEVKLDWEHTEYRWIEPKKIKKFEIVYGLDKILDSMLKEF